MTRLGACLLGFSLILLSLGTAATATPAMEPADPSPTERVTLEQPLGEDEIATVRQQAVAASQARAALSSYTDIGPGSELVIDIEDHDGSRCTANFVWEDTDGNLYLGTAGHCVLPSDAKGTHGPGASFDPDLVTVWAATNGCLWDMDLGGCPAMEQTFVELGDVVYASQDLGDAALVELPPAVTEHHLRTEVPDWGGPEGSGDPQPPLIGLFGQGQSYGSTTLTEDRLLTPLPQSQEVAFFVLFPTGWAGVGPADYGDSGAPVVDVAMGDDGSMEGREAVGLANSGTPPFGVVQGPTVEEIKYDVACFADLHVHVIPGGEAVFPEECSPRV